MLNLPTEITNLHHVSILVVEDDVLVRSTIVDYLHAFGFKRIQAPLDSRTAVKLLLDKTSHFDLVLSDWMMPGVDGLELLRLLRKINFRSNTKFIMITSQVPDERAKIAKAKAVGVDAYIVKPFKGVLLKNKIWSVLGWGEKSDFSDVG